MKRIICCVVLLSILLCFAGCSKEQVEFQKPVKLYYCRDEIAYNSADGVFMYEYREFSGWEDRPRDFLNTYFSKPTSEELSSPFPFGAWILELTQNETQVDILLNVHFSRLAPNELTIACACLSLTVFDLLNADTVSIRIDNPAQEQQIITMTKENLVFSEPSIIK